MRLLAIGAAAVLLFLPQGGHRGHETVATLSVIE
jgi:hypothetical protein